MAESKKIAVIGDEDTIIGFGLTGIKHLTIVNNDSNTGEIKEAIKQYILDPTIGFVLITQEIAERVRQDFEKIKMEKTLYPIFIELPDKHGIVADRIDPIKILIRRAIGMEIVKEQ